MQAGIGAQKARRGKVISQDKEKSLMKRKAYALLGLAAVVGLLSAGAASAKQTKQTDVPISGSGSSLVNPLVQQFIPAVGSAFGYSLSYASVGSGTGYRQHHGPHLRLRRLRCPAQHDPGGGLRWLRRDPVGALGDHALVQHHGRSEPDPPGRLDDRRDLPRNDHELERPEDREAEPEAHDAEPGDHARASLGRIR